MVEAKSTIRVLLAADSAAVRLVLTRALESDPDLSVVATVANGVQAVARLEFTTVDVVVIELEKVASLKVLRRMRSRWPLLPIVLCERIAEGGSTTSMEAFSAGATAYLPRPSPTATVTEALSVCDGLARVVRSLVPFSTVAALRETSPNRPSALDSAAQRRVGPRPEVLAIASSTGGPNALTDLWRKIPQDFPAPIVLVQHMPPVFTGTLARRLTALGGVPVREGLEGEVLVAGEARIAPGGHHMELVRRGTEVRIRLHDGPPEHSCRPAADVLFRSVARVYGASALGVVLTGMGQDGLAGSRALVEAGSSVLAQDEASSIVWGMPGFIAREGVAREVLPLTEIAPAILRAFRVPSTPRTRAA